MNFINLKKWHSISRIMLFALCAMTLFSSCEEEDEENDEVTLYSFGPSGVNHGDTIKFVGLNLDKVTAVILPAEVEVTNFVTQTSTLIELAVPKETVAGKVKLVFPKGEIESKAMISFEVPVEITSITAEARPGDNVTITGDLLNWIDSITFESGIVVKDFESKSVNELVVKVPMEAQTGYLIFATGGTEPLTFASENELVVTLPEVTELSPAAIRHTDDLTIKGSDLDLVTSVIFNEGLTVYAADFASQSATEIVVEVPAATEDGVLTLTQASPVYVETSQELQIILPKGTSVTPSPAVPGEDDITITGTDLDLVAEVTFTGAGSVTSFVSQSETEIVVAVPGSATLGPIGYVTIHGYAGGLGVVLTLPGEGPPPLIVPLFEDALASGTGQGGGWSSTTDFASTENAREGSTSMKVNYTGSWGGGGQIGTWGQNPISVSGTEVLAFSIFGTEGTGGQQIQVVVKDGTGEYTHMVGIEANTWKDVEIPLSELGNLSQFTEIFFQNTDQWTGTIFIDRLGFSMAGGPAALTVVAYDDAISDLFGQGGGWTATTDFTSTELMREGSNAIKITYAGGWGGGAQFGTWGKDPVSVAGTSNFVFSVLGGAGAGAKLQVVVKDAAGNEYSKQVDVTSEWTDVEIPLSELGNLTSVTEIFFQDTDWTGVVYIDYVGFR